MDQALRNKLRNVVTKCRKLLEDAVAQVLQGQFGIYPSGKKDEVHVEDEARMGHLGDEDRACRNDLLDHFQHIIALGYKPKDALAQLVREVAFTHLNRLCAYKMMEAREVWVGGQRFREAVSRGLKSQGFLFYLAQHPEDEQRYNTGHQDVAYRHFLDWLGGTLSDEIGVLFSPTDPANRLYPPQRVLDEVLDLLNTGDIKPEEKDLQEAWPKIWSQDETIGWVYQYFTPKELRDQARKESAAPRNSYELAFRNQFFTPRYVVQFLTDNTLGRIWYEMRQGQTKLTEQCSYMVRRPNEVFLAAGQQPPAETEQRDDLSQQELLKQPVHIPHRPKKDPRELRILDPACGSGHFLLYCFDLLLTIYEEAWADAELGPALQEEFKSWEAHRRDVPRLILAHNLHGIDIDLRATQIAALALWLRCQRAYKEMGLTRDRPKITRSNIVCAEPMPGEKEMLKEFVAELQPPILGHLVEVVFDKMALAAEAGSLLKIEEELRSEIATVRKQWVAEHERAVDRKGRTMLFSQADMDRAKTKTPQPQLFDLSEITDEQFWTEAEGRVLDALRDYASHAATGGHLRRQLFAEDAGHGFAFVDVCQRRFDVVLMNPPFGLCQKHLTDFIWGTYPDTYVDLCGCFVTRAWELTPHGVVGAITSRSFLVVKKLSRWRSNEVVTSLDVLLDLGGGVMDNAYVESCAYVLRRHPLAAFVAIDRRTQQDKTLPFSGASSPIPGEKWYCIARRHISRLPEQKLLYTLPRNVAKLLETTDAVFEPAIGTAREGMRTFDNFRFLRLRWEVPPATISAQSTWEPLSKGGDYSIYYADIHMLVKWNRDGLELAEENMRVNGQVAQSRQASEYYRRPGGTYSKRSAKGFSVRALPAGCIIGDIGPAILSESDIPPEYLIGWLNSRLIVYLIHLQASFAKFNTGVVKRLPWRMLSNANEMAASTKDTIVMLRTAAAQSEVNSCFCTPPLGKTIRDARERSLTVCDEAERRRSVCMKMWNQAVDEVYGVDSSNLDSPFDETEAVEDEEDTFERQDSLPSIAHSTLSYAVGCVIGRWDVRLAKGERQLSVLPDPFESLPACPPGMLQGANGLPAIETPPEYPLRIDWDGILTDESEHPDDIVRRVRDVLEVIWKDRAEAIEKEACEIMGVKGLRDYFRKPGNGGFWADHISRYSKSRRKAPIYWLLQSAKKNYALWLYYHRLDKDILFKALVNYVEPKIRLEESRVASQRSQKEAGGSKKLDKEIEKQEDFLSELRDFEDKLRRAANLHLEPDLNDGVVLNIAPLWELVPWKEAKAYWEELMEGKYEWSSIGKQLRAKGLVR